MRPITGDCSCGRFFLHPRRGGLRIYCDECRKTRKRTEWNAEWYVKNRKNSPRWRALNKRRAKAWRAANRDHIRAYIRAYNEARA